MLIRSVFALLGGALTYFFTGSLILTVIAAIVSFVIVDVFDID